MASSQAFLKRAAEVLPPFSQLFLFRYFRRRWQDQVESVCSFFVNIDLHFGWEGYSQLTLEGLPGLRQQFGFEYRVLPGTLDNRLQLHKDIIVTKIKINWMIQLSFNNNPKKLRSGQL
jgi:hypothetical protein